MKRSILTLLLALSIGAGKAQTFNANLATMLQDTLNFYQSMISNVKGMSASVYIPGQGMWQGTAGVSYTGQPITSNMEFGIASNSKLFVSTIMLMLQEDNILSLDDSVHNWLPNYPNVNPNITIRQLLNHTSGLPDPIFTSPWMDTVNAHPTRVFTPNEVLSWLGAPLFAPGAGWNYSNVNYILAGMIAQQATGYHISQLIRDSILTPLNMDSTFYDVQETVGGVIAHRWWNTIDYNDTSRVGLNTAGGCAGSIFSTASEMSQWYRALFGGQLLNANSMMQLGNFVATSSPTMQYGLGIDRETTQNRTYWGHGGTTWGYRSKMIYDTCMHVVVCGLTNSYPSGMEAITFLLYRTVVNHVPGCAGNMTGPASLCAGTNNVTYTVPPIPNATSYMWTLPSGVTGTSNTNSITVDFGLAAVSGTIMVSGVNNYGAGGNASIYVTVNPIPPTPVITLNGNTLSSSAPSGNQWYNSAGAIPGATNQTYLVTATDDYYCVVTLNNCSSDSSNNMHVIPLGIASGELNAHLNVYPNPASSNIHIDLLDGKGPAQFRLFDNAGQMVMHGELNGSSSIDLTGLSNGIYLLDMIRDNETAHIRIVKQ